MTWVSARPPSRDRIRLFQEIGRRLDAKGFIAANDGNLSAREEDDTILITASGAYKGHLREEQVVRIDAAGKLLQGEHPPSSEASMHLAVYRVRPEIRAVVHAHPPIATGFAVARQPMDACVLPEIVLTLGSVPIAPYGTPGTEELPETIEPVARAHDVFLLANHGAVALGASLEEAYFRMERVEHTAKILLAARLLGHVERLPRSDVERLLQTGPPRAGSGLPCLPGPEEEGNPARSGRVPPPAMGSELLERERLRDMITEILERRGLISQGKE